MNIRQRNQEESFCAFISTSEKSGRLIIRWQINAKLAANLQRLLITEAKTTEADLTQLFLKQALENKVNELSRLHLCAYLDDICYWLGIKTAQKVANIDCTWIDCFQIARAIVAQPEKLFKSYNHQRSNLKTYAQIKIKTVILEVIHFNHEVEKHSPVGLLRKITKKTLEQALEKMGMSAHEKDKHILAWLSFKEIYHPQKPTGSQKLSWPTHEELEIITTRYNQISQQNSLTREELEAFLKMCIDAVYHYTLPNRISLDENLQNISSHVELDTSKEVDDNLEQWQEVTSILSNAFEHLLPEEKLILNLSYGLNINQTDISKIFSCKQYQISRKIDRIKRKLLEILATQLNQRLTTQEISEKADQVDDWLEWYCQIQYHQAMKQYLFQEMAEQMTLLKLYSLYEKNYNQIATVLELSPQFVGQKIESIQKSFYDFLKKTILQEDNQLDFTSINLDSKLEKITNSWLLNAPYAVLEAEIKQVRSQ